SLCAERNIEDYKRAGSATTSKAASRCAGLVNSARASERPPRHAAQAQDELDAAAIREIVRAGAAAMRLGDEPYHEQAESEMGGIAASAAGFAHADERIEQAVLHRRWQERPAVRDGDLGAVVRAREPDLDPAVGRREAARVVDELVERLRDELGCAVHEERLDRHDAVDAPWRRERAIGVDAAAHDRREVEIFRLRRGDRALHAARLAHRAHERTEALRARSRTREIRLRIGGHRLVLEI